jgi:hydrogenase-4 component F
MTGIYLIGAFLISLALFLNRNKTMNYLLAALFILLQLVFTVYEYQHLNQEELGYFMPDSMAILLLMALTVICIPTFYHSYIYFRNNRDIPHERSIYHAATVVLVASLSAAYLSSQIGITWIFIEITTLSASALIYHRRIMRALEGTWKYIFVCSISLTFVFIGILFLTLALKEEGLKNLSYHALIEKAPGLNVFWLKLAFLFIFTGYTAKAGLVPMYTAGIDAKDKAPSPAGALIGSVLMNVGFLGIFRFYEIIAHTSILDWANKIILLSGLLSVFVATVYILRVRNFKRILAYSGVYHMGLVVIGLASGGIGCYAAVLHLLLHTLAKPTFFFQTGQLFRIYKSKSVYAMGNYFKYNLSGALVLLFGFFIITAMPPSGMFVSEFLIFRSMFEAGNIFTLVTVLLLLTIIIWSFGSVIFKILFIPPVDFKEDQVVRIPVVESLPHFVLLGMVIWLGIFPPEGFVQLIKTAVTVLNH